MCFILKLSFLLSLSQVSISTVSGVINDYNFGEKMSAYQHHPYMMCPKLMSGISAKTCVKECLRRPDICRYLGYDRHLHLCFFCTDRKTTLWPKFGKILRMMDMNISAWTKDLGAVARCNDTDCSDAPGSCLRSEHRDVNAVDTDQPTEPMCPVPAHRSRTLKSRAWSWKVGTRLRYTCATKSVPLHHSRPYITCQPNLTWTFDEFKCLYITVGNVALNKETAQSSTQGKGFSWLAVNATGKERCSSTKAEPHPWWQVTLAHISQVSRIIIANRQNCCGERLHDVNVTVYRTTSASSPQHFATFVGPGTTGQLIELTHSPPLHGQRVQLQITKGDDNILTLCDVKIFEK